MQTFSTVGINSNNLQYISMRFRIANTFHEQRARNCWSISLKVISAELFTFLHRISSLLMNEFLYNLNEFVHITNWLNYVHIFLLRSYSSVFRSLSVKPISFVKQHISIKLNEQTLAQYFKCCSEIEDERESSLHLDKQLAASSTEVCIFTKIWTAGSIYDKIN